MTEIQSSPLRVIPVANILGEGIQWNSEDQSVWWTDIGANCLHRYRWETEQLDIFELPEALCSFAFTQTKDEIIAAFATGFARYNYATGALNWIARPELDNPAVRFNDGRADRQGRFWSGTMVIDDSSPDPQAGALYCLDTEGSVSRHLSQVSIANGICWSPDSRVFYFADSPQESIVMYDFDSQSGSISNRRGFVTTTQGVSPDGANVDAQGNLWSAHWGGCEVVQYRPDGKVAQRINLSVSQPTCVAFGGPDLNLLFVSTAKQGLSDAVLEQQPQAGHVFVFQVQAQGLPECRYDGSV